MPPAAIVTGSDSGIGKAAAVALADAGFDVGVTWHADEAGTEGTAEGIRALGPPGGGAPTRREGTRRGVQGRGRPRRLARGARPMFVNNAGTGVDSPFLEQSLEEWREVIETDLTARSYARSGRPRGWSPAIGADAS